MYHTSLSANNFSFIVMYLCLTVYVIVAHLAIFRHMMLEHNDHDDDDDDDENGDERAEMQLVN